MCLFCKWKNVACHISKWNVKSSGPWEASLWTKLVEVMEFQFPYFKSWKLMLWKCCTQYASKFGKFNSGHRTGKAQFSFQYQRKVMPKNAQITAQLHSSNMLVKLCSKFSKPGFNSTWTMNFQMFKLDLEKAEEAEINLSTSVGSLKKQESSRKTFIFSLLSMPKPLHVWITRNCGKFWERWPDHLTCLLGNLYAGQETTVRTGHGATDWFQIRKGIHQSWILSPCLFNLYAEYIMRNAGLDEAQARIKIARRNIKNLRHTDDTILIAESKEELKSLLMKFRGEWKCWLKLRKLRLWHLIPSLLGK